MKDSMNSMMQATEPAYRGISRRDLMNMFQVKGGSLVPSPKKEVKQSIFRITEEEGISIPVSDSQRRLSLDDHFLYQHAKHGLSVSPSDNFTQPRKKRSKKKLRFADEEGGSLENVREFTKDECEKELELSHLTSLSSLLRSELDLDRDDFGVFEDDFDDEFYEDDVFVYEEDDADESGNDSPQIWEKETCALDSNNNAPRVEVLPVNSPSHSSLPRQFSCALPGKAHRLEALRVQKVVLDRVEFEDTVFHGTVLAQRQDEEECSVKVRVTFNDWDDFVDVNATCRGSDSTIADVCDSDSDYSSANDNDMEPQSLPADCLANVCQYDFEISIPSAVERDIQFAICFEKDGRPFWDTNEGDNYIALPC